MRRNYRRIIATAAVSITLAASGIAYSLRDPSPIGYWRSAQALDAYTRDYTSALATLPTPTRTIDTRTTYGIVRSYQFGPDPDPGRVPIVLLPGRSSGVPMWSTNLPDLIAGHTVVALDALGDAGMSIQHKPLRSADDQAAWLDETLTALNVWRAHLVGHSFGGASAAGYAIRHPHRVASVALLEPILVFAPLQWQTYIATIPSALPFSPQSWRNAGLASIGGADKTHVGKDPISSMIESAASGDSAKLPTPKQFSPAELARLTMPVFVALGGRSNVIDAATAQRTARELPHARVRVWPHAAHSLPMEIPRELSQELDAFYAQSAPTK